MLAGRFRGVAMLGAGLLAGALSPALRAAAPDELAPEFVRPLSGQETHASNDASPVWGSGGALLAFERAEESRREIVVVRPDGAT
ncbi:MAG: hypothetical protein OEV31_09215, partial [Gammaproteobacteria bacterium]|nr:hypothetical protein [Gammaproteobacteria bacterium]